MTDAKWQELRRRLVEAVEAATPDEGLLKTGTGVAFWRERTFLSIASIIEEAVRTTYTEAIEEAAKRAFEAVQAVESSPVYKAAQVAASIRNLVHGETEGEGK